MLRGFFFLVKAAANNRFPVIEQICMAGILVNPWKATSVYRYKDGDWLSVHENWSLIKQ